MWTWNSSVTLHDDVIKWKPLPHNWPFVWGINQSPVNSPHKGQWCGALMFSLICAWITAWVNNHEAVDLIRHYTHYDVIVMEKPELSWCQICNHQWHWRLSSWQLVSPPVTTKISSWQLSVVSVTKKPSLLYTELSRYELIFSKIATIDPLHVTRLLWVLNLI